MARGSQMPQKFIRRIIKIHLMNYPPHPQNLLSFDGGFRQGRMPERINGKDHNSMSRTIKIALVGSGMFGGDVQLRAYGDVKMSSIAPFTGRLGLDHFARDLTDLQFEFVAVATRTEKSAQKSAAEYAKITGVAPKTYHGDAP